MQKIMVIKGFALVFMLIFCVANGSAAEKQAQNIPENTVTTLEIEADEVSLLQETGAEHKIILQQDANLSQKDAPVAKSESPKEKISLLRTQESSLGMKTQLKATDKQSGEWKTKSVTRPQPMEKLIKAKPKELENKKEKN